MSATSQEFRDDVFALARAIRLEVRNDDRRRRSAERAFAQQTWPRSTLDRLEDCEAIAKALDTLDQREREVIRRHFGLLGNVGESLEEIAWSWGVSLAIVVKAEQKAPHRLRGPMLAKSLAGDRQMCGRVPCGRVARIGLWTCAEHGGDQ